MTKQLDTTRLCIDTSGNYHTITDIFDVHDYEGDPVKLKGNYAHIAEGIVNDGVHRYDGNKTQKYNGEPVFISEYGGIRWSGEESGESSWGYGDKRLMNLSRDTKVLPTLCWTIRTSTASAILSSTM